MRKNPANIFRTSGDGLGKVLGHLEKDIMDVMWSGSELSGKDVFERLCRRRNIALTTVLTVLNRLVKKDLVRKEHSTEGYMFKAALTMDEFSKAISRDVLEGVIDLCSGPAVASFVDILAEKDPAELMRLERLVEKKKLELKGGP